jgi:UDP-N-acetylmuramate dehydrogenase
LKDLAGPDLPRYPALDGRVKVSAAKLIEKAGFARGHRRGGAAISSRHTLALVNRERATAQEILDLAREIRDQVRERFGVALTPEPVLLGFDQPF